MPGPRKRSVFFAAAIAAGVVAACGSNNPDLFHPDASGGEAGQGAMVPAKQAERQTTEGPAGRSPW